jgi:hypothetical protein
MISNKIGKRDKIHDVAQLFEKSAKKHSDATGNFCYFSLHQTRAKKNI